MKAILTLAVFFSLFIVTSAFATIVDAGEQGVVYNCAFTFTVTLDGDFADWPDVPWQQVTHDMGWSNRPDAKKPNNDNDASYEFACVADENNLYVAIKTWDDAKGRFMLLEVCQIFDSQVKPTSTNNSAGVFVLMNLNFWVCDIIH